MSATLTAATITVTSGNSKTGKITVISRSIDTCPSTCPFLDADAWEAKGCYGAGRMWAQVNRASRDIADLPRPKWRIRDRVLGDVTVPRTRDDAIDWEYLQAVNDYAVEHGSAVFGYTHSQVWKQISIEQWLERFPAYTMNISCHTADEVLEVQALGWNAVLSTDDVVQGQKIGNKRVAQCPATYLDDFTCAGCDKFCTTDDNNVIPWFPLHGVQVKKARAAVAACE